MTTTWQDIGTAPRDGRRVELLIPYNRDKYSEEECIDVGHWDALDQCFRFDGDDGPDDIQPTHWRPSPPSKEGE